MSLLQAIVLGIVQGLTEFLPISSTAHLRIVPELLGWSDPKSAFSAVIQLGTLAAVLIYFRRDLVATALAWIRETLSGRFAATHEGKLGWMMIIGTVPVVVGGLVLKKRIDSDFRRLAVVAGALIFFSLLLWAAEAYHARAARRGQGGRKLSDGNWGDAITVGLAQALALVPGASRSGVTITASLFRGLEREAAARFSFLLSIPAVFAAGVYQLYKEQGELLRTGGSTTALIVATVVSGLVGYASIALLLRYLRTHTTYLFVVYRMLLGATLLALVASGKLSDVPAEQAALPTSSAASSDTTPSPAPAAAE